MQERLIRCIWIIPGYWILKAQQITVITAPDNIY